MFQGHRTLAACRCSMSSLWRDLRGYGGLSHYLDLGHCVSHGQQRKAHTISHQVPFAQRDRSLKRRSDIFQRPTGLNRKENFLASPTTPAQSPKSERNPKFAHWRQEVKGSKTPEELLSHLFDAFDASQVDCSVISACMQTCGDQYWWSTLLQVHDLQKANAIKLGTVGSMIFLNALRKCCKTGRTPAKDLLLRREQALALGKQICQELSRPKTKPDYLKTLGCVYALCAAIGPKALPWAMDFQEQMRLQGWTSITRLEFGPFLALLEQDGQTKKVDELLQKEPRFFDEVLLGELVNVAGTRYDWKRVEHLWVKSQTDRHFQPNELCYRARCKAHMLCGRPTACLRVLDEMRSAGFNMKAARTAAMELQALIIICHSGLSKPHLHRLSTVSREGFDFSAAAARMRSEIKQLKEVAQQLMTKPSSLVFPDLLVDLNCKQGKMGNWPNHKAGSKYLKDQDAWAPMYIAHARVIMLNRIE